ADYDGWQTRLDIQGKPHALRQDALSNFGEIDGDSNPKWNGNGRRQKQHFDSTQDRLSDTAAGFSDRFWLSDKEVEIKGGYTTRADVANNQHEHGDGNKGYRGYQARHEGVKRLASYIGTFRRFEQAHPTSFRNICSCGLLHKRVPYPVISCPAYG